ncbi:hypothetical protein BH23CHL2_BH23CHL2_19730 [soil metagenome]
MTTPMMTVPTPIADRSDREQLYRQVLQAGWTAFHSVKGSLGVSLATATDEKLMAVLRPIGHVLEDFARVGTGELTLDRVAAGSVVECLTALERGLGGSPLPPQVRVKLARFYGFLVELLIDLPHHVLKSPDGASGNRLLIPTALLYQMRQALFPAERMAVGAVRVDGAKSVLEAVFDVTGDATETHVDGDPRKLGAAFIAIEAAAALHRFNAHSHPGDGPEATEPSPKDRDTPRRRVSAGDSRQMICAIFAGRFVRFFRPDADLKPVAAGKRVEFSGPGLRAVDEEESVYVFGT